MKRLTTKLVWDCDVCSKPIADGDGYVQVDRDRAVEQYREHRVRDAARGDGPIRASEIEPWSPAPWHAHHRDCDPYPDDGSAYFYDIERIRTFEQLLQWNRHLSEKNWIHESDWFSFIQRRFARYRRSRAGAV